MSKPKDDDKLERIRNLNRKNAYVRSLIYSLSKRFDFTSLEDSFQTIINDELAIYREQREKQKHDKIKELKEKAKKLRADVVQIKRLGGTPGTELLKSISSINKTIEELKECDSLEMKF